MPWQGISTNARARNAAQLASVLTVSARPHAPQGLSPVAPDNMTALNPLALYRTLIINYYQNTVKRLHIIYVSESGEVPLL